MTSPTSTLLAAVCLAALLLSASNVQATDPELVTDFFVPPGVNASSLDGNFFTFTGFRGGFTAPAGKFANKRAFVSEFPALNGLGVSMALLSYQAGSINPPHIHPRASEILYILQGCVTVGLIDTSNKLFSQTLWAGDAFVFPKGLAHFQINTDPKTEAKALASFSSSNPGLVSFPATLFGSGIEDAVLQKAFQVSAEVIASLKEPFDTK